MKGYYLKDLPKDFKWWGLSKKQLESVEKSQTV